MRRIKIFLISVIIVLSCVSHAEEIINDKFLREDNSIIDFMKSQHYAGLLFHGQTDSMNRTRCEVLGRFYSPGKHYHIYPPVFEAVHQSEFNCLVKFVKSDAPMTLDGKPTFKASDNKDILLNVVKNLEFPRFSRLSAAGITFDTEHPKFDDLQGSLSFVRTVNGVSVYNEKISFSFSSFLDSIMVARIYAVVTFDKILGPFIPVISMETANAKAMESLNLSTYVQTRKQRVGNVAIETIIEDGQLAFAHPNVALEDVTIDYKKLRDTPLRLCYVFRVISPGLVGSIFIDAETGLPVGGERFGE